MVLETDAQTWARIKRTFIRYGFSGEEANWAAENSLDPRTPDDTKADQIIRVLRNRQNRVRLLMRYSGYSRAVVVKSCDQMRREKGEREGYEDLMNLFIGESP